MASLARMAVVTGQLMQAAVVDVSTAVLAVASAAFGLARAVFAGG